MTEIRWYRLAFILPLIVPIVAAGVWLLLEETVFPPGEHLSNPELIVASVPMVLFFSGVFGGVPYALLAGLMLAYLWPRSAASYRRAAFVAPLLFVPLLLAWAFFVPFLGVEPAQPGAVELRVAIMFAGFGIGLGYLYVLFALLLGSRFRVTRASTRAG